MDGNKGTTNTKTTVVLRKMSAGEAQGTGGWKAGGREKREEVFWGVFLTEPGKSPDVNSRT